MGKIRIGILFGGRSGEHEVSLRSAASVIKNLDPNRYDVIPIGIDKEGNWHFNDLKLIAKDDPDILKLDKNAPPSGFCPLP